MLPPAFWDMRLSIPFSLPWISQIAWLANTAIDSGFNIAKWKSLKEIGYWERLLSASTTWIPFSNTLQWISLWESEQRTFWLLPPILKYPIQLWLNKNDYWQPIIKEWDVKW
jgi:hypothetical protein